MKRTEESLSSRGLRELAGTVLRSLFLLFGGPNAATAAMVLAGAAAGHPSAPETTTKKVSCSVDRAIFDVLFMQLSMASWGGFVCSDGTFEVSGHDLRKGGRLSADRLAELRRLLATLPVEKSVYNFGGYSPDLFELYVRTYVGGRRSHNVFLEAERSPTVLAIFAAAQILRETFESKWAQLGSGRIELDWIRFE